MSLNKVILQGRLCADPEVRYTQGENPMCIARYRLAVNRDRKEKNGNYSADFIGCVAFGKTGEHAEKFFKKGMQINVTGRWQTGDYTGKDGKKVYTNECVVQEQYFTESRGTAQTTERAPKGEPAGFDGFMSIPEGIDEELPFN